MCIRDRCSRRQHVRHRYARGRRSAEVEDPITHKGITSEPGRSHVRPAAANRLGPHREGEEPKPMMHEHGKSDSAIVAAKPTNKAGRPAAEPVERRAGTEGNAGQHSTRRAQYRESVSQALGHIRQIAKRALRRQTPEVGAVCGKSARTDLCGGRPVMDVPTAILKLTPQNRRLTGLLSLCLYSYACPMRGASRGVLEVGQVRRPRACLASTHSGGPGSPSVPTTGDCL